MCHVTDVFGKAMNHTEALGKRSAALGLKGQAKLFKPKDGVHDPVIFFHESRIIDFLAVGKGFDKRLKSLRSCRKESGGRFATSPETFSAWSIWVREKPPVSCLVVDFWRKQHWKHWCQRRDLNPQGPFKPC
jgi:hypothetical protein